MKIQHIAILFILLLTTACSANETETVPPEILPPADIRGMDLSSLPEVESYNAVFYNQNGEASNMLDILKQHGVNTVRLRLWHSPASVHSSFQEVKEFSNQLKDRGFRLWLTVHYSDSWAHPGQQVMPVFWQNCSFDALKDSVFAYTAQVVSEIQPQYLQIGNEINTGFLFPHGELATNEAQFLELLSVATQAVRQESDTTQIMLHFAGIEGWRWFFSKFNSIDYDMIGISYYPFWHGKDLQLLQSELTTLSNTYNKTVVIAETAYPFTLDWNDYTNNLVGLSEHLILPDYPATPQGQFLFMKKLREIVANAGAAGFCYWGAERIAFKGPQATDGSGWENLAVFDFNHHVLPVIEAFHK